MPRHSSPVRDRKAPALVGRYIGGHAQAGSTECGVTLDFLRSPPGNQLEALKGDRAGQHSIRINDQWRVCFVWRDEGVFDVEIVDYH